MRVLRGFPAQGIVACYVEPSVEGDIHDIDAPCNAPAKSPMQHLDKVAFHSSFFNYELAVPIQTINVTHPRISTQTTTWGAAGVLAFSITGTGAENVLTLFNHNLGYTPLVIASYQDAMIVSGMLVQSEAQGARFISLWADNTSVGLSESAYCGASDLPEAVRTYKVLIFRTPAPNPDLPLFSGGADTFQIGRGMIDSSKSYLKRDPAGEFAMDLGRTLDISGGGARFITGGVTRDDNWYNGGFSGTSYIQVGV